MRPLTLLGLLCLGTSATTSPFWYESINHNGINPTITNGHNWTVFRNVKDYGAIGDGIADDTAAIQRAIATGDSTGNRESGWFGSTGQPAVVYFPSGTYLVKSTIRSAIGTVIMGNPTDRPVIRAAADFSGTYLLFGRDRQRSGLVGFYHGIKNLVLDSTLVPATKGIALLEWSVSQGTQLSNVAFKMPVGSTHVGLLTAGMCSGLIMNDLEFQGGGTGILLTATQYHLKSISFKDVKTGIKFSSLVQGTGQGLRFENCDVGIDAAAAMVGMFSLIDSSATNTSTLLTAATITNSSFAGSLVLENVQVDSSTVKTANTTLLTGSISPDESWIRGNTYSPSSSNPQLLSAGQRIKTTRPLPLIISNTTYSYPTIPPPTYAEYTLSQIINIKDVSSHPVKGDGVTDDTANIQAILTSYSQSNTSTSAKDTAFYFPHGIYILTDTLYLPPGTRMIGEALTQLSASGEKFMDADKPRAMMQVGKPGEVGVAQLSDFVFTVADILPGVVSVEVNMRGEKVGDVGIWNCHFRVGGARGSKTRTACANPQTCLAARLSLHLTPSSSAYIENTWSWTADHDLDGGTGTVYPGTAAGFLIEAQHGTWILGSGVEHHVLYQINIHNAKNVFIGLQEGESAYWQGPGNKLLAPKPWAKSLLPSDPDFSWCAPDSEMCRMGLYQIITNSTDLNIYSSGFWNFVAGPNRAMCATDCQESAALYGSDNKRMHIYGFSTINNKNLIVEGSAGKGNTSRVGDVLAVATREANSGQMVDGLFKTAIVAAYLRYST
ncbi:pectate lyase superfamily protein-domain-containing protein [Cercophora newfieldiana]|uniref:Pectate lyase superfamily protein-domain-containing protein n=1 Tax=Cercophora newfieldiana TaxID=92897 RepID=A0AA39YSL9_9PEZI|nr:pectate lyase superfamily protein-domain-containing protein [Cercophora newfieldiana]